MRMASWHWGGRDHAGTISPDGREATRPSPSSAPPPVEGVTLCAPLPRPLRSLDCIGRNCHAHARERVGTMFRETLRGWISGELRGITLHPGDVIATGTPAGVGMRLTPPQWLKHGDGVRIEIDGIGTIENRLDSD